MLAYYLHLALRSLRRNTVLSVLIVGGIAIGIGVSTTFSTLRWVLTRDPLPNSSDRLHYVRLDSWDPAVAYPAGVPGAPPPQITYRDMRAIMQTDIPLRQTATFRARLTVYPEKGVARPLQADVRMCFSDFFAMFEVPFAYGAPWDRKADAGPEPVVVISSDLNETLFGGADSTGRTLRIDKAEFRIVGVLAPWRPSVRMYDLNQNPLVLPEQVYMPFDHTEPMQVQTVGNTDGWGPNNGVPGFAGFLQSETVFLQMWVELKDAGQRRAYEDFLAAYVAEQKKAGRFGRPLNNRVTPLLEYMDESNLVPPQVSAMTVVSLLFLLVCALNLSGLLLAKFLARGTESGVRRALGARRVDIFAQHLIECELVGVVGGVLGLGLAGLGLLGINQWAKQILGRGDLFALDVPMAAFAILLSLVAGLVAGAYPAWRACRIPPAIQLKVQ